MEFDALTFQTLLALKDKKWERAIELARGIEERLGYVPYSIDDWREWSKGRLWVTVQLAPEAAREGRIGSVLVLDVREDRIIEEPDVKIVIPERVDVKGTFILVEQGRCRLMLLRADKKAGYLLGEYDVKAHVRNPFVGAKLPRWRPIRITDDGRIEWLDEAEDPGE